MYIIAENINNEEKLRKPLEKKSEILPNFSQKKSLLNRNTSLHGES